MPVKTTFTEAAKKPVIGSTDIRVRMTLGVTVSTGKSYQMLKPEVGAELNVPVGMTVDDAYDQLYDYLEGKLSEVLDKLGKAIE